MRRPLTRGTAFAPSTAVRCALPHSGQSEILIGVYKAIAVQQGPPKLQAIAERDSAECERFDGLEVEGEGVAYLIGLRIGPVVATRPGVKEAA